MLVATAGGYAKRTPIEDYPVQGRGGKGVLTLQYDRRRGTLVGALIVGLDDELYAITSTGGVIRTSAREVRKAGRQTKGVRLMNLGESSTLLAVARNAEDDADDPAEPGELTPSTHTPATDRGELHPVSDAKRTPDAPGRGSVATGQQPVEPASSNGSTGATAGQGGADNGRAVDRSGAHRATADGPATRSGRRPGRPGRPGRTRGPLSGPAESDSAARQTTADVRRRPPSARVRHRPAPAADPGDAGRGGDAGTGAGRRRRRPGRPADLVRGPPRSAEAGRPRRWTPRRPFPHRPRRRAAPSWRRMPGHDAGRPARVSAARPAARRRPHGVPRDPALCAVRPGWRAARQGHRQLARIPRPRPPRQAALQLRRLDPWSVLKLALVLAVVLFFIWLVAVGVLYGVLDGMGVWDRLNGTYADLVSGEAQTGNTLISAGRVFGLPPSSERSTACCSRWRSRSGRSSTTCPPTWSAASR